MPADSGDSGCSSGSPSPAASPLPQPDYQDQELAPGVSVGAAILAILTAEYVIEDDETSAFVVAHEMAHHDLGHLRVFPKWLGRLAKARGVDIPFGVLRAVEHRLYGPEWECEADDFALQLCLKAGYDGHRCLRFFQILENHALNLKQDEAVYGPDPDSDEELSPQASFVTKARIWAYQRSRGYLPIRDRWQRLAHLLEESDRDGTT